MSYGSFMNEMWVSNVVGNDFKVNLQVVPRVGEYFHIEGSDYRIGKIVYTPLTTEYEKTNECVIGIVLENTPKEAEG